MASREPFNALVRVIEVFEGIRNPPKNRKRPQSHRKRSIQSEHVGQCVQHVYKSNTEKELAQYTLWFTRNKFLNKYQENLTKATSYKYSSPISAGHI